MRTVKFSTAATWLLVAFLAQLLITQWTVKAAGNQDVLDYVSFAGTVVGMILAMLAIVYSFLVTASQKSDADGMRGQLLQLNESINRVNLSGVKFEDEVERLEGIRAELSDLSTASKASLQGTERLEAKIDKFVQRESSDKVAVRPARTLANTEIYKKSIERIVVMATPPQLVMYFAVIHKKYKEDGTEWFSKIVHPMIEGERRDFWHTYAAGEAAGYYLIFIDLEVFSEDGETKAHFLQALKIAVPKAIERVNRPDFKPSPSHDLDGLKKQLEVIAGFLNDSSQGF